MRILTSRFRFSLAALAVLVCLGCNSGRSTARLGRIDRTVGNTVGEWDYRYSDSGALEELQYETGGSIARWDFSYDNSGTVNELRRSTDDEDLVYEFTYEDGRLVEKRERQGADYNADSDLEYDSNGKVLSIRKVIHIGSDTTREIDTTLDRDNEGRLVEWSEVDHTTIEIPILGDVESTTNRTREFRYDDDGHLEEIRVAVTRGGDTDNSDVEYRYDDNGRLAELFDETGDNANLDYDDQGRIEEVDYVDQNDRYSFSYDEGTASGVGLEPFGVPYATFFDVEGQSFSAFDFNSLGTLWGL